MSRLHFYACLVNSAFYRCGGIKMQIGIILGLASFLILAVVTIIFILYVSRTEKKYKEQLDEEVERIKNEEVEKTELKESLSSGNHTDDVNNMLDILCKHK